MKQLQSVHLTPPVQRGKPFACVAKYIHPKMGAFYQHAISMHQFLLVARLKVSRKHALE